MTPAMIAALSSGRAFLTALFEFDLPSGTRHLMLGSSEVQWNSATWLGYDPTIGSISAPDDIQEDMTGQAPNSSISITISPTATIADIAGPLVQLSAAKCWLAALQLDGSQHLGVVPDPELIFDGFIDQATIDLDKGRNDLEYTLISAFDYFFEDSEGQRLNGQFHQLVWPGEKGLDNVSGVTKKIYWGTNAPAGQNVGNGSGGSSSIINRYAGGGSRFGGYDVREL